ncbi:MAG: YlxR family protein [Bacilli bacterium]
MKTKVIPLRSCVVTREKLPKKEMLRVVRDKDGKVTIDLTGKANGRGAYVKKDIEVVKEAKTKHALERHLEVAIPDDIFEQMIDIINKDEK